MISAFLCQPAVSCIVIAALQARRQDSVTRGAEINFRGAREVYLCEFEKGTRAREICYRVDQTNKVKTKKKVFCSKIFTNSGYRLKILSIFHEFLSEDQKKRSSSQNFYEISQKLRKYVR